MATQELGWPPRGAPRVLLGALRSDHYALQPERDVPGQVQVAIAELFERLARSGTQPRGDHEHCGVAGEVMHQCDFRPELIACLKGRESQSGLDEHLVVAAIGPLDTNELFPGRTRLRDALTLHHGAVYRANLPAMTQDLAQVAKALT